jgi:phosphoribosyl 1,2-cyclic phosphodiesterase
VQALDTLAKRHPMPIHAPTAVVEILAKDAPRALKECLVPHAPFSEVAVGGFTVKSFPTPHDSVMSVGYRMEFADETDPSETRAVGIATDIGCITRDVYEGLSGCEAVCVESNHDVLMLQCGPYPQRIKNRILSNRGHLSNADSARLVGALSQTGTRRVMLCHLSVENNSADLAFRTMANAVGDVMQIAVAGADRMCWMPEGRR